MTVRTKSYLTGTTYVAGQPAGSITSASHRDFVESADAWIAPAPVALTDGATITWDLGNYPTNHATVTLGGNRTLAFSNGFSGCSGVLVVTQDATGSRTLALPSGSKVVGGSLTLSTAANAIDVLSFVRFGTTYYWTYGKAFA